MIVGLFTELTPPGGIQRAGRHVAAVLTSYAGSRGWPVNLLSLNDAADSRGNGTGNLPYQFTGYSKSKARFLYRLARLAAQRPRLALALHPNLALPAAAMKAVATEMRIVVCAHGQEVYAPLPPVRRWGLLQADLVLAPSRDTAAKLISLQGLHPNRVERLPWGLDPEFDPAPGNTACQNLPAAFPRGNVILTVGRLETSDKYKGVDTLIQTIPALRKAIPDVRLAIVGDGGDRTRLEAIARSLDVTGHVQFLGFLRPTALADCLAACTIFALPSSKEGFGLVFLEAMAQGKPVVGGAHGGTLDIIEDGVTGRLVRHGDREALTTILRELLVNPQLCEKLGQRARAHVEREFRFDHFEKNLAHVLDQVSGA